MNRGLFLIFVSFILFSQIYCDPGSVSSGEALRSIGYAKISVLEPSPEVQQSLDRFMAFKGDLQKRLIGAIQEKGAPYAIQVCSVASPEMEQKHSEDAWKIYRVSDKPRNPDHRANEFEAVVIEMWKQRLKNQEPLQPVHFRTEKEEYVMSPIPVQAALCLQCHGGVKEIKPQTRNAIEAAYPDDEATGYSLGELRGAFVSRRSL
ncbi:MAG TPA: hypothetical protein DEA96_06845 [Leptospiraceae bacterium]|nr:hypothetical protein [Spirochaetaceae bacterium]HBS04662.1 hypothetical protein [Leptospiraceae bacterium]|tara:strand:+ start:41502 stop:42116 length:615 start_codon:yes stop_codon:yes gene_type:complete